MHHNFLKAWPDGGTGGAELVLVVIVFMMIVGMVLILVDKMVIVKW